MRYKPGALSRSLLLAIIAVTTLVAAVWWLTRSRRPALDIRNIVLISIDTCRADYLSCYGYKRQITPNIDELGRNGVIFRNAISPVPITLPAHCSMLTGKIPPYHGVHDNQGYRLADAEITLAEIMTENGFTTGAAIGGFPLDSRFGLDQGFQWYDDNLDVAKVVNPVNQRRGEYVTDSGIAWLEKHQEEKLFLFLHYYDPHFPYEAPQGFKSESDAPSERYAAEIGYTDHCIGRVVQTLKRLDLYDSTLIIITSDHGESLGEHGEDEHGYFIYQGVLKVPLIFKLPEAETSRTVAVPAGLIDIVPTLCVLLGRPPPDGIQGMDLSPYLLEKEPSTQPRSLFCESLTATKYGAAPLLGLVTDRWKYIYTKRPELYDLVGDAAESSNLLDQEPDVTRRLTEELRQMVPLELSHKDSGTTVAIDLQSAKRLQALGYIGGPVVGDLTVDKTKDDPKDLLEFHERYYMLNDLIGAKEYERAEEWCRRLLQLQPDFLLGHVHMGDIALAQGTPARAEEHYHRALQIDTNHANARVSLGQSLVEQDRLDEAITQYRHALGLDGDHADAHRHLANSLHARGDFTEAVDHYLKALRLQPDWAAAHYGLARVFESGGNVNDAIVHYQRAVQHEPGFAYAHNNLANLLAKQDDLQGAIQHLRAALSHVADSAGVHHNLGVYLGKTGDKVGALEHLRKAQHLAPESKVVLNSLAWILATDPELRQPDEALRLATRALELNAEDDSYIFDTLGVAYAAAGRFDEAIIAVQKALSVLDKSASEDIVRQLRSRLALYEQGKAYVDP